MKADDRPTPTGGATLTQDFRSLALDVRAAGLFERRVAYYWAKIVLTIAGFVAGWAAFFALGASWPTLGVAAFLGIMSTQLGFLGHDAGHGQIFRSPRANRLLGVALGNCLIGLSFGWWVPKHNAHHAHPNEIGRDPDIGPGFVGAKTGNRSRDGVWHPAEWMAQRQAQLFFPLMLLRSTGLYVSGIQDLIRRRGRPAVIEGALLLAHVVLYLGAVLWVLSPLQAIAFFSIHQAVFSLYLGCSFAPNHKGMPLVDSHADISFVRRQVLTARNIAGGKLTEWCFGGLNYQIEHHLFPTVARPNLSGVQQLVRPFCLVNGIAYCEESVVGSYRRALRHLHMEGSGASLAESPWP